MGACQLFVVAYHSSSSLRQAANNLAKGLSTLTGLQFAVAALSPFLYTGVSLAVFQESGIPSLVTLWKSLDKLLSFLA